MLKLQTNPRSDVRTLSNEILVAIHNGLGRYLEGPRSQSNRMCSCSDQAESEHLVSMQDAFGDEGLEDFRECFGDSAFHEYFLPSKACLSTDTIRPACSDAQHWLMMNAAEWFMQYLVVVGHDQEYVEAQVAARRR